MSGSLAGTCRAVRDMGALRASRGSASNCTAAIATSAGPQGGFGWSGVGAAPVPTVELSGATYYMAGTLDFGIARARG